MRMQKGFTLIELLIVVAIIGIIAAIAIPNLLDAIERSRQKRSTGEIRTMCSAMQTFSVDYGGYPSSAHIGDPSSTWPLTTETDGTGAIIPDLIQAVSPFDAWSVPFAFETGPDGTVIHPRLLEPLAGHFVIYSLGADRAPSAHADGSQPGPALAAAWCQEPPVAVGTLLTHCYESDIVWGDSHFQQSPEGKQRKC